MENLHSLQVQRSTATGTVTLTLVNVTKPRFTNALFWDTGTSCGSVRMV